ncbi:MAG TPA: hypothetical protein VGW74_21780, partial [Propionibacteriaceae bacterium]|nr:hypothetical protein [Propionibacteriaceae bacterium]
ARRSERARTRNRRRLRNGVPVDRDHGEPAPAETPAASATDGETGGATGRRRRRQRDRRPDRGPHLHVDERPKE